MRTADKRQKDSWYFAGGPSEYGHPKRNWGPRQSTEGWLDRAHADLRWGDDAKFRRLIGKFNWFVRG